MSVQFIKCCNNATIKIETLIVLAKGGIYQRS